MLTFIIFRTWWSTLLLLPTPPVLTLFRENLVSVKKSSSSSLNNHNHHHHHCDNHNHHHDHHDQVGYSLCIPRCLPQPSVNLGCLVFTIIIIIIIINLGCLGCLAILVGVQYHHHHHYWIQSRRSQIWDWSTFVNIARLTSTKWGSLKGFAFSAFIFLSQIKILKESLISARSTLGGCSYKEVVYKIQVKVWRCLFFVLFLFLYLSADGNTKYKVSSGCLRSCYMEVA